MDANKEKHAPEKSPSFAARGDDGNNDDDLLDQNQNQNQNSDADNPPRSEKPSADVESIADNGETGNKDEADNAETGNKDEDSTELPSIDDSLPSIPDLGKVSEEIDQFISALSTSKLDDHQHQHQSEPPEIPEFVEQFAFLIEANIANFDPAETTPRKWSQGTEDDSSSFLESINRISKLSTALCKFSLVSRYASSINRIGGILQRAMSFLEEEFRSILEDYQSPDSDHNDHESKPKQLSEEADQCPLPESQTTPEHNDFPGYSGEAVSNLSRLGKAMISGGHETECCQLYFFVRRHALEDSLHKLGFQKFSIDDIQKMHWESLEREIAAWMKTYKQFATVLFPCERRLTEAVFSDHDYASISENLFISLSRDVMFHLLNFAEAVAMTKRSAEKLFKFLDIYETLRDLIPAMAGLFPAESLDELKFEASLTRCRLGEATISIFGELENSIKADTGKIPVPGGAVHPLTRYTMNYLKYACEYKETLDQVFREHHKTDQAHSASGSDSDCNAQAGSNHGNQQAKQSPLQLQLFKVMDLLDANLDAKSKLYKDSSLSLVFMMNNGRYILQKIKAAGEINSLMGDPWSRKRSSELRQYHTNYKRETWGKLLNCLNHEGLNVNGKVVKPVLKERFKSFNAMFDEIHRTQSAWVVSDEQLQSELRVSISAIVIPAYRSFMGRFSQIFTPGRQTEKYIKYQPEDIETHIDELFDGNAAAPIGRRRQ